MNDQFELEVVHPIYRDGDKVYTEPTRVIGRWKGLRLPTEDDFLDAFRRAHTAGYQIAEFRVDVTRLFGVPVFIGEDYS